MSNDWWQHNSSSFMKFKTIPFAKQILHLCANVKSKAGDGQWKRRRKLNGKRRKSLPQSVVVTWKYCLFVSCFIDSLFLSYVSWPIEMGGVVVAAEGICFGVKCQCLWTRWWHCTLLSGCLVVSMMPSIFTSLFLMYEGGGNSTTPSEIIDAFVRQNLKLLLLLFF